MKVYDAPPIKAWKKVLKESLLLQGPYKMFEGPVAVDLKFRIPRPKSHFSKKGLLSAEGMLNRWPLSKRHGDVDNLAKAVLDVMTEVGIWEDDALVVGLVVEKEFTPGGRPEDTGGVRILVESAEYEQ